LRSALCALLIPASQRVSVYFVAEFDNIETLKAAVEIDTGISIVPQSTVTQEVANRTLAAVPLEAGAFHRPTAIICRKRKALSPATKQFLAILKNGN
jgi:DNA-binding transcriptional LysR family regulator